MGNVSVLIADDHTMIADAFRKLLEPRFEVVGVASDGKELLQLAQETKPDVVLLDLRMPTLNGFDAGRQLKKLVPATKITGSELLTAIAEVMKGKQYLSGHVSEKQLERFVRNPNRPEPKPLTPCQREVLQQLAIGRSMKQAAAELHVTTRTIAFHKYSIMREHNLKTTFDLLRFAFRQEIAPPSSSIPEVQ